MDIDYLRAETQIRNEEERTIQRNNRILSAIRRLKGEDFYKKLLENFEENPPSNFPFTFVDTVRGVYDAEEFEYSGLEIWVDQYCNGGYSGDDYAGFCYLRVKKQKFLKYHYTM